LNSTERWDHVPRGTMDEVSSSVRLDLPLKSDGKAALQIVPPRLRIPCWKGRGADSEEKHEPASDIDTVVVDSLKALDPERPIREADLLGTVLCSVNKKPTPATTSVSCRQLLQRRVEAFGEPEARGASSGLP